jgi:DUF971 family protein
MAQSPTPLEIKLHQQSNLLEIHFDNETECMLSCEFLRVHSPSAEVQGHSPQQAILQVGKVGNYAIKIIFSDGHDTGIYSWDYLYRLGENYEQMWLDYLGKLEMAGHKRKAPHD